jgi:hypothetical protein
MENTGTLAHRYNWKDTWMKKATLSRAALIARIRRKLAASNERLKIVRDDQKETLRELGNFFTVSESGVTRYNVDLPTLARRLKLLEPWEEVAPD